MNARTQRLCVWAIPVCFLFLCLALLVPDWIPFPSPNHSPEYVGDYYQEHTDGIRLGSVFMTLGAALLAPLAAVMTVQMKRIEGEHSPMAYLQLGMGSASPLAISIVGFFWWTAAFRPERDPVVTQSWHDAGWLCFTAVIFLVMLQLAAIAIVIFSDDRKKPLFPRWVGYLTIWVALLLLPSIMCLWFKTGPFAWSGVFTLYLAFVVVGTWFIVMIVQLLRVIREQEAGAT